MILAERVARLEAAASAVRVKAEAASAQADLSNAMRIFSLVEYCFPRPADVADKFLGRNRGGIGFLSYLGGYDEPEILRSSNCQICLRGAEAEHRRGADVRPDWQEADWKDSCSLALL